MLMLIAVRHYTIFFLTVVRSFLLRVCRLRIIHTVYDTSRQTGCIDFHVLCLENGLSLPSVVEKVCDKKDDCVPEKIIFQ